MSSASEAVMGMESEPPAQEAPASEDGWPQTHREFEQLIEEFQDRLVQYAFRRLGSLPDAEDVAQEVFVRAYADRERRRRVRTVGPYLFRMAANLCLDQLRRRKWQFASLDDAQAREVPDDVRNGAELAAAAEESRRIGALLDRLPARQAETIRMKILADLSLDETAQTIGCPLATVKSRLRYGLEKLRKIMLREKENWR